MAFGKKIRSLRKKLSMTQIEFSKKIRILQGNLSSYEHERNKPSLKVIFKLLKMAKDNHIEMKIEDFLL